MKIKDGCIKGYAIRQPITIGRIPLPWRDGTTSRPCFLCPRCERHPYKLYMLLGAMQFFCRVCHHIGYELQTLHHGGLPYLFVSLSKSDLRAERLMRRQVF